MRPKELLNLGSATITQLDPDDFRWCTQENAHVAEVNIFRNDDVIILSSVVPNCSIWHGTEPYLVDMLGRWKDV